MTLIALGESVEPTMIVALSERERDVVVIGGGIRKPEPLLTGSLFERHPPPTAGQPVSRARGLRTRLL